VVESAPTERVHTELTEISEESAPQPRRVLPEGGLPNYTTEELATLLEGRRELSALIDECSQVFGKIFNTHEVSRLLGLVDYLNLSGEYLLLLLAHCVKIGKKSLRYVESVAIALYDDGVTDVGALQQCLKMREQREEAEGKIRAMFGISNRSLTTKERKMIDAWLFEHKVDLEVIRLAYERTVDAIGKASVPYANSIVERWASEKLLTAEAILAAEAEREKQSAVTVTPGNSFDTHDFFDAALQRSFGEDYIPAGEQK
jgi:DnaD/phage-associated family protein